MKYIFSFLFALILTISNWPLAIAATSPFPDVDETNPYLTDISFVKEKGISQGDEKGLFNPERGLSRCELLKVAILSKGITAQPSSQKAFSDLELSDWCNFYASYGKDEGIINGYPDGTFRGNNFVTEIEAMKILLNALEVTLPTVTVDLYKNAKVGEWWTSYLQYIKDKKVEYMPDTEKYPLQDVFLRKKMARVLYRVMTMKELGMTEWSDTLPTTQTITGMGYTLTLENSFWSPTNVRWETNDLIVSQSLKDTSPTENISFYVTPETDCSTLAACWEKYGPTQSGETAAETVGTFKGEQAVLQDITATQSSTLAPHTIKRILTFKDEVFYAIRYNFPTTQESTLMPEIQKILDSFTFQ